MKRKLFLSGLAILALVIGGIFICTRIEVNDYEREIKKIKTNESYPINIDTPIEHKELKQDGYSIHYFTSGDSANELIVFLHPAFADHRAFDKQIDFFSRNYRVIAIDLLGHGLSDPTNTDDKIDSSAEHIDAILALEGDSTAHLVGVSMGALIAQYYALKYPEKILTMTVLGGYDINVSNNEIVRAQRSESFKWIYKMLVSMNSFRKHVANVSLYYPEEQVRFYDMAKSFSRKSFLVMQGMDVIVAPRKSIAREYPLLILCGDKDIDLAQRMSKQWHEADTSSKFHSVKNAGHCANMDKADDFNELVASFIGEQNM
jgi:3-oxoadipate enol-lactonase